MANVKFTELTEDTAPTGDDLIATAHDPDGTPASRKVKILNLLKRLFLDDDTQLTWGAVADGEFLKRSGATIIGDTASGGPATQIEETSGPDVLDIGNIVDGEFLKRVGSEVVSASVPGGAEAGANSDITSMDGLTGALETVTRIDFAEGAAPSTPGTGEVSLYAKSDGKLYIKDDAGTETDLTGGGGGSIAPLEIVDANTVRQKNGATAQTFQIFQNATINLSISTVSGAFEIAASSGNIKIVVGSSKYEYTGSALLPPSGAGLGGDSNRWGVVRANEFNAVAGGQFRFNDRSRIVDVADGWVLFRPNSGETAKISFADTGGAAAMLKRNGTDLEARTGSDSAYSNFIAAKFGLSGTAVNISSGSGSPEGAVTASVGSLYLRTDGGANTTLYVKESGSGNTGWVAK